MSETSQGPGWWEASDGKFYPPHQHPDHRPPAQPPPAAQQPTTAQPGLDPSWAPAAQPQHGYPPQPVRGPVSKALSIWLQVLWWVWGALAGLVAMAALFARSRFEAFIDSGRGEAIPALIDWEDADSFAFGLLGISELLFVAVFVLQIVWMFQLHKAGDRFAPVNRSWSRGWTVGGWFIPLAWFVIPKLVLDEEEKVATAPKEGGRVGPAWKSTRVSAVTHIWWFFLCTGTVVGWIGQAMTSEQVAALAVSDSQWRNGYALLAAGGLLLAAAGLFGGLTVMRIARADREAGPVLPAQYVPQAAPTVPTPPAVPPAPGPSGSTPW